MVDRQLARKGTVAFGFLLAAFAVGFLLFGEFGGWYYAEGGLRTSTVYDYDNDRYDVKRTAVGNEYWDSDGLFTEATLIAPLSIAVLSLGAAMVLLVRLAFGSATDGRGTMMRVGVLAAVATVVIGGWSIVYGSSMGDVTEWWFGSAFYAGLINSALLAVMAFASLRFAKVWRDASKSEIV